LEQNNFKVSYPVSNFIIFSARRGLFLKLRQKNLILGSIFSLIQKAWLMVFITIYKQR